VAYYMHEAATTGCSPENKMKALATILTLSAIISAAAFGGEKGAEKLAARKFSAPASASAAPAVNCRTETRAAIDRSARGAVKTPAVYTAHACPSCETKGVSKGAGKLAVRSLVHSCEAAAACCPGK
jgi:hypothetical protein